MTKVQINNLYKYKIKEKIDFLPNKDFVLAKIMLPKILGINKRTFEKYMYTKTTDSYEVPADRLAIISNFFNCTMEEMFTYFPKPISNKEISKIYKIDLASQLGLTK